MKSDKTEHFIQLLGIYTKDAQDIITGLYAEMRYYSGLIIAAIGGAIYLILIPTTSTTTDFFTIGVGVVITALSFLGWKGLRRAFNVWLEVITTKSKIENKLGLWEKEDSAWNDEAIIYHRHIRDAQDSDSSKNFVSTAMNKSKTVKYGRLAYWALGLVGMAIAGYGAYHLASTLIITCRI